MEDIKNIIKEIRAKKGRASYINGMFFGYSEYISENLNSSIKYTEYLAEQLMNNSTSTYTEYVEYLAEKMK